VPGKKYYPEKKRAVTGPAKKGPCRMCSMGKGILVKVGGGSQANFDAGQVLI